MKADSAIVLGSHVQALGVVRALGRAGIPVTVIDHRRLGVARLSRYARGFRSISEWSEAEIVAELGRMTNVYGPSVIFPTDDIAVAALARNWDELSESHVLTTPSWDVTRMAYNKILTYRAAQACGVPIPETYFPKSFDGLMEATRDLEFPMILKPAVMHRFYRVKRTKVLVVPDPGALATAYQEMIDVIPPREVMVQDLVPGGAEHLYSLGALVHKGEIIAGFTARRKRQIPMDFGNASTFVETCDIPQLATQGSKILRHINYTGLAEVEFKYDMRDRQYKLLEINPRLWKWHSIAEGLDINLPLLQFRLANGASVDGLGILPYQECKWTDRLSDWYVSTGEILKGRMGFGEWLRSYKGLCVDSVFSWSDPVPGMLLLVLSPYLALTR